MIIIFIYIPFCSINNNIIPLYNTFIKYNDNDNFHNNNYTN